MYCTLLNVLFLFLFSEPVQYPRYEDWDAELEWEVMVRASEVRIEERRRHLSWDKQVDEEYGFDGECLFLQHHSKIDTFDQSTKTILQSTLLMYVFSFSQYVLVSFQMAVLRWRPVTSFCLLFRYSCWFWIKCWNCESTLCFQSCNTVLVRHVFAKKENVCWMKKTVWYNNLSTIHTTKHSMILRNKHCHFLIIYRKSNKSLQRQLNSNHCLVIFGYRGSWLSFCMWWESKKFILSFLLFTCRFGKIFCHSKNAKPTIIFHQTL